MSKASKKRGERENRMRAACKESKNRNRLLAKISLSCLTQ